MERKPFRKIVTAFSAFALVFAAFPTVQAQTEGLFKGSNGYYIEVAPEDLTITTNKISQLEFDVYYLNPDENELENVNTEIDVYLDGEKLDDTTIENYETGEDKSGDVDITLDIVGTEDPVDEVEGSVTITLNYLSADSPGAKFYLEYEGGKKLSSFNNKVTLEFPENSYITSNPFTEEMAPDQTLLLAVEDSKGALNNVLNDESQFYFLSNSYTVTSETYQEDDTTLVKPGTITLNYDLGNLSPEVAKYNISVAQEVNGKWLPIGGIVDSKKSTVKAPISEFGNYAAIYTYKTYSDVANDWAQPAIMALAYKGIIAPKSNITDGTLIGASNSFNDNIQRLDFTVMLTKGLGYGATKYKGYFNDLSASTDGADYVMTAVLYGLITGSTDSNGKNMMAPNQPLTREQAAVFAARALKLKVPSYTDKEVVKLNKQLSKYYSDTDIAPWAAPYIYAITKEGIMQGTNGMFKPKDSLSIKQASQIVYNIMIEEDLFGK